MNRLLKILAIAVLLVTVLAAGAVLYGMTMFEPQAVSVSINETPVMQAQAAFDQAMDQLARGTFAGTQFAGTQFAGADDLGAQEATFLTYTVRLKNRGFFPAEWITLLVEPRQDADGYDVLQLADERPRVLGAGSEGDLSATILRAGAVGDTQRNLTVVCYVFGQRVEVAIPAAAQP